MKSFIFDGAKKPMTTDEWNQAKQSFARMPTDAAGGLSAVAQALFNRQRKPFPAAPGGSGNMLSGLFGLGAKSSGLY